MQQARSAVRCSASHMKGEVHIAYEEPLVRGASARCEHFLAYRMQLRMNSFVFWCMVISGDSDMGILEDVVTASWSALPYMHYP